MTIVGFHCQRGYRTNEECLECHRRCILIAPVKEQVDKMKSGYYKPRSDEYHVTSLLGCPRKAILGMFLGDYIKPLNLWKMELGTLCHAMMEKNPPGRGIAECQVGQRFYIPIQRDGMMDMRESEPSFQADSELYRCRVVGRFDWRDYETKLIHDYKFVWGTQYMPDAKHYRQLATYYILGTKSGAFNEEDVIGGEIDYVDITTAIMHPYRATGEVFKKAVAEQERDIPKMLGYIVNAKRSGVVPDGVSSKSECDYCGDDIKRFCLQYAPKYKKKCNTELVDLQSNELKVLEEAIEAYRKLNTPSDDEE